MPVFSPSPGHAQLRRAIAAMALLLTASLASGCQFSDELSEAVDTLESATRQPTPTTSPPMPSDRSQGADSTPQQAYRRLAKLPRAERPRGTAGYQRSAFGSSWRDTDGNGCNQRDDVLLRDAVPGTTRVARQGACDHDVLAGTFVDPYAGRIHELDNLKDLKQAQSVQIDHVVPLAEAWVSGAANWTDEQRVAFANDLDVLLAVDGSTNASKGASDPAAWRPRKGYQCQYAKRWIAVKHRYGLSVDASEHSALEQMLGYCSNT